MWVLDNLTTGERLRESDLRDDETLACTTDGDDLIFNEVVLVSV
nr:hypothetical protein [Natronococcus pandeyae]